MRRTIRSRFTFANIVAGTALFVALGGGAYAATSSFVGLHGNINTCVPPAGGEVNVWKPGHRCTGGRVGLAFPVNAQPGATGSTGPTGLTGATGATGQANPVGDHRRRTNRDQVAAQGGDTDVRPHERDALQRFRADDPRQL